MKPNLGAVNGDLISNSTKNIIQSFIRGPYMMKKPFHRKESSTRTDAKQQQVVCQVSI